MCRSGGIEPQREKRQTHIVLSASQLCSETAPRPCRQSSVASTVTKTVLIVDDSAYVRHALYDLFTRESDFAVCGDAENGKEAIEKAKELRPDLIVLDLSMPVMNGFEAALVLKRLMPTVPLIMYSALGDQVAERQARLIGISEVVSKSEHASVLILKARSLLYSTAA
jgi:two-component system, chemotaxis family, chemotaxis protein CheY